MTRLPYDRPCEAAGSKLEPATEAGNRDRGRKHGHRRRVLPLLHICFFVSLICVATAGNGRPPPETSAETYRFRCRNNFAPYEFVENGKPAGFDVELLHNIAELMDFNVEIVPGRWAEMRRSLEHGNVEGLTGMYYSTERDETVDFSAPFAVITYDIFVREGHKLASLEEARGLEILVERNDIMHDRLQDREGYILVPARDDADVLRRLASGKHDCAIAPKMRAHYIIEKAGLTNLQAAGANLHPQSFRFAVAEGEQELLALLNEGLNILKSTGRYREIHDQWFGTYAREGTWRVLRYVAWAGAGGGLLLVISLVWSWSLSRRVRNATKELREAREGLDLALKGADMGLWEYKPATQRVKLNSRAIRLLGYPPSNGTHRIAGWQELVHPEDLENSLHALKEHMDGNRPFFEVEHRLATAQGKWRWILTRGRVVERDDSGQPLRVSGTHLDISRLKRAMEALRHSQENLRITLDSIGDAVIATDAQTRIIRMNPMAESIIGWQREHVLGRPLTDIISLSDVDTGETLDTPLTRAIEAGITTDIGTKTVLHTRDGEKRQIADSAAPIRDADNNIVGGVLVFRDVTDQRRLERQFYEAQKMESIGRLASGVAHDFNNLLTGIMGYAELLQFRLPQEDGPAEELEGIFEASERARELITQLLTFSRKAPRKNDTVDLHRLTENAVSILNHTLDKRIRLEQGLHAKPCVVRGDSAQLQNAILNLAVNARDAMPRGGVLSFTTDIIQLDEDFCKAHPYSINPGEYLELQVSDTGIGMDRNTVAHIFEPFFTTKETQGGTGLGLAAVYGTIKNHGGLITVYSEKGQGTVFKVRLPLVRNETPAQKPHAESLKRGSGRILLVDDEDVVRLTAGSMLEDLGYEVCCASDGEEAVDIFSKEPTRYELIILDLVMPRMDGRDALKAVRDLNPNVPVLLCSGFAQGHRNEQWSLQGAQDFLQKPYRKAELARRVASLISREAPAGTA